MPELPEVDTVAQALQRTLPGKRLVNARFISRVRQPFCPKSVRKALSGHAFILIRRRAKYIVMEFDAPHALVAHLGMTGSFRLESARAPLRKHDRIVLALDSGEELRYADIRRFGFVSLVAMPGGGGDPAELSGLGCEPLERGFTVKRMLEAAAGRRCPVKVFIMDQAVVVGVGNIYASEALYLAGIDPGRPVFGITAEEWKRLVGAVRRVLREAIRAGGSTIRDYRGVDGAEGGFQRELLVYGLGGGVCSGCGGGIVSCRLGGRSTFYCPVCQK